MSEQPVTTEPQDAGALTAQLVAWRREGASRAGPVHFHFLEALARRVQAAPAALQARLLPRLRAGLADYAARLDRARQTAGDEAVRIASRQPALARQLRSLQAMGDVRGLQLLSARSEGAADCVLLAQLNRHISHASPAVQAADPEAQGREELASVRRFRRTWGRGRSQDQLARATSRKPANAGPLNSHALVLQSLALMQELSPDYLRHFMTHVEALQWLETARDAPPPSQSKPTRRSRSKG